MITRYVPLGLLFILIFLSCKTFEIPEESPITVEQLVEQYGSDYRGLIVALEELEEKPHELLVRLYFATGDLDRAVILLKTDPLYMDNPTLLELALQIEYSRNGLFSPYLERLLELQQGNITANNIQAEQLLQQGELDRAEGILNSVRKSSINSKTAILLGDICLERVERMGLKNKKVLSEREDYIITALYNKALNYYLEVGESSSALYYKKLADIHGKLGDDLERLRALELASDLDSLDPWVYYDMGKIYFYRDSYDRALENLLISSKLQPDHFFTNVFLGRTYFKIKEFKKAFEYYSAVLEEKPDYYPAYFDLSIIYYLHGMSSEALRMLQDYYAESRTRDPFISLYLVNSYLESGNISEGRKILQKLVKYENNSTILGVYRYMLNPQSAGDAVLNDILVMDDSVIRSRLSYYIAEIMKREGIKILADSLYVEVAESEVGFESILAKYYLSTIKS